MNILIAVLLLIPMLVPSPKKIKGPTLKCKDFIEIVPVDSGSVSQKLLIKRLDATPDHVYSCIRRRDLRGSKLEGKDHKEPFKKNQIIKVPKSLFLAFSPWILEYQYSFGSIDSTEPSRTSDVTGQTFFLRYSKTVKNKLDVVFWLGLNKLDAKSDASSAKYKNSSLAKPVGQFRLKFNYNANWSYYTFVRIDRYPISGIDSNGSGILTFTSKIDNGVGVEKSWGDHWISRLDSSLVFPSLNKNNNVQSGIEVGVEIEYLWKDWIANYRISYLNLKNQIGSDTVSFQALRLGYRF